MTTSSRKKQEFPPLVQATRDWAQMGGGDGGSTDIKQIEQALMPAFDTPMLEMLIKSNVDREIEADIAFLIAEGVEAGEIDFSAVGTDGASFATVFTIVKTATSYALDGKGREQVVQVLSSGAGRAFGRMRRMFGRGGGYEGGAGGFQDVG